MPRGRPKADVAPCQFCNKRFRRTEHLKRHERTHTQEKPFACDCGQSFTRQDLLARHVKLSHSDRQDAIQQPGALAPPHIMTDVDVPWLDCDDLWNSDFLTQELLPPGFADMSLFMNASPPAVPRHPTSSLAQFSSRLPTVDDVEDGAEAENATARSTGHMEDDLKSWHVSEPQYDRFCQQVNEYSAVLPPAYLIPSRDTLSRYLELYLVCAHKFLPFVHPATFSIERKDVGLVLAATAVSSLYRFDHAKSNELYFLARAIFLEQERRRSLRHATDFLRGSHTSDGEEGPGLERLQTLVLLILFSSWADKSIAPEALSMASRLATLAREAGISKADEMQPGTVWLDWVAVEERRRTLLAAYVLLNLHSVAYGVPPLILSHEIGICLPGCGEQWQAENASQWDSIPKANETLFSSALTDLFQAGSASSSHYLSPFANYVLIHGILQQIYIDRHRMIGPALDDNLTTYQAALSSWQSSWERTDESTLDPLSPKGPLGLAAAALLRLAYIRLKITPSQGLLTRDLSMMTIRNRLASRTSQVNKAVLQAAHALSIPARLGIDYVARSKPPIWTIEHSLCSLECARLLRDWLESIATTVETSSGSSVTRMELKLLGIIASIVKEAELSDSLTVSPNGPLYYRQMTSAVLKLWAQIFKGVHILDIDNIIGESLQAMADAT